MINTIRAHVMLSKVDDLIDFVVETSVLMGGVENEPTDAQLESVLHALVQDGVQRRRQFLDGADLQYLSS